MKKTSIQVKIGFLLSLAVLLLSATCYLSYRNLSSIVSSLQTDAIPEFRLLSIREISDDLIKADNSIRIYTVTKDTHDLRPYYSVISGIDEKVDTLRSQCLNDTILLGQIGTISKQIEKNIIVWNQLLYLTHDDKVIENLQQLSDKINSVTENNQRKEKGILRRVFSAGNKNPLNGQELIISLQQIEQQDRITKEKIKEQESQLAGISSKIKDEFYNLIAKMENEVSRLIKEKALAANHLADNTYKWLIIFLISGGSLALLVLVIIIRYIRKTRAYQSALENSKEEAEKLARTKEMFIANMSHEIRTPVTAISGFTEQLLHKTFDEDVTRTLRIIKSSSDHLAGIINDILDFSKLQNDKLVLEKVHFSIGQILEDVYVIFEMQAKSNNTELSYSLNPDTPSVLLGDPFRLKQIIINLVSNSVKFTKDGKVNLTVSSIKKQLNEIELILEVVDTGIGIDENKLKIIFDDFTQAETSTSRKYGGTGLGLSIVKKIVELYKGTIECKSSVNNGTRITCNIPFRTGDPEQLKMNAAAPLSLPVNLNDLNILIVDDEEYNRLLFKKIFQRWKINYDEAVNGMQAIEKLKGNRYNLLLMDIRMPEIDGIEATKYIRDELKIKEAEMPIICISAAFVNEDRDAYKKAGINAFLKKPFTEEMLLSIIRDVVQNNHKITIMNSVNSDKREPLSTDKINLHNLYHISGGDEQFVKQMLASFIYTTKKGLVGLHEAVLLSQWETVASLAHKLLAPCRHIGAMDLCNILGMIEKGIKKDINVEAIEILSIESLKEFEVISGLLNEHITKMV